MRRRARGLPGLLAVLAACEDRREPPAPPIAYADVAPLVERACAPCHGPDGASAIRLTSHYRTLGCTPDGRRLVEPRDESAPLVAVLERPDHAELVTEPERALLARWVRAGAPARAGSVHPGGILDPRSAEWHGRLAARGAFAPLRDPAAEDACGRCHDGSPVRPAAVRLPLADAPACTSCHAAPGGVLACATCHGDDGRAYPPRDPCYFPDGRMGGLHAQHLAPSPLRAAPLPCAACHPALPETVLGATHGNGDVELAFDATLAGPEARFDPESGTCTVGCHARGGTAPTPSWTVPIALDCNSCHLSPPPAHYPGACSACHRQMGAAPTSLLAGPSHIDGTVEQGAPLGSCGACHGRGLEPWPQDATHRIHRDTTMALPVTCADCHPLPASIGAPGHLDGEVDLLFSQRAEGAPAAPSFDPRTKVCSNVACHGAALRSPGVAPRWEAPTLALAACDTCHGAPPPPPHTQQSSCGGALCHGERVRGVVPALRIAPEARDQHVDGVVQTGP